MQTITQLTQNKNLGWHDIQDWLTTASNSIQLLPKNSNQAETALLAMQITTNSLLGAVIYETGGILVDEGWLRILGSGSEKLQRSIDKLNQQLTKDLDYLIVADDVIGGIFALNGGYFGGDLGQIYYFAPDTLMWENLDIGYSHFLRWAFMGDLQQFYSHIRWKNWQTDMTKIMTDKVYIFYPPLFTIQGQDIETISKSPILLMEYLSSIVSK